MDFLAVEALVTDLHPHAECTDCRKIFVSLWRVSFQLDGDYFLATMVTIEVAGPQDALGAQQEALSLFRRFAHEIGRAAEHFQPFSD
jgi:hypothetical protein